MLLNLVSGFELFEFEVELVVGLCLPGLVMLFADYIFCDIGAWLNQV